MKTLKEAMNDKHMQATYMPFNERMMQGLLLKNEYLLYLIQQKEIFKAIENHPLPSPDLNRTEPVQKDIDALISEGIQEGIVLKSTQHYVEYLNTLNQEEKLPHVYMNYLALAYGGQMMKKRIPTTTYMYEFENMTTAIQAVRNVQKDEWADEVNKGFDFLIAIFEELETERLKNNS